MPIQELKSDRFNIERIGRFVEKKHGIWNNGKPKKPQQGRTIRVKKDCRRKEMIAKIESYLAKHPEIKYQKFEKGSRGYVYHFDKPGDKQRVWFAAFWGGK